MYNITQLNALSLDKVKIIAKKMGVKVLKSHTKQELVYKILDQQALVSQEARPKASSGDNGKTPKKREDTPEPAAQDQDRRPMRPRIYNGPRPRYGSNDNGNARERTLRRPSNASYTCFDGLIEGEGVLDMMTGGYAFLRSSDSNYLPGPGDIFVSGSLIRSCGLKFGDTVAGKLRTPRDGEKYFGLMQVDRVNGRKPEEIRDRVAFEHLTPLFAQKKFNLSNQPTDYDIRIIDFLAPMGFGQRGMIVAPPKAGKTSLLKHIANAIAQNHEDVFLNILMVGERPEEVTDMSRSVRAEVIASTFDESPERQVRVANMVLAKAKNMVECGHHVVILLDSITRLTRAHNAVLPTSGRILSGGIDANALHKPKNFFGSARNTEEGGSLTIIATALVDTESKMDAVIIEEFKGTGNMEVQLDRNLANKGIYPSLNVLKSSTRRSDLLQSEKTHAFVRMLRHLINEMNTQEAITFLLDKMKHTKNNEEFLASIG